MQFQRAGRNERIIHLCLSCLLGALLAGCGDLTSVEEPSRYAVYAAVLQEEVLAEGWGGSPRVYPDSAGPIEHLVVLGETDPEAPATVSGRIEGLDRSTITDYEARAGGGRLEPRLEGAGRYILLSTQELQSVFQNGGWTTFYQRFRGAPGLVAFSQVGIGCGGTQALVYMMHLREGLWGHGSFYVLTMERGEWRVTGRHKLWSA